MGRRTGGRGGGCGLLTANCLLLVFLWTQWGERGAQLFSHNHASWRGDLIPENRVLLQERVLSGVR